MSCYRPLGAYRDPAGVSFHRGSSDGKPVKPDIWLPCGMCIGCRAKRASDWSLRCMHEASLRESNCFVTLTYGPGNLPAGSSLCHRDFQLFMKRLRKRLGFPVRYFMCGEYGDRTKRPHYHACLFGVDFRSDRQVCGSSASGYDMYNSPLLTAIWTHGICTVQDLTRETSGYCARYVMKKLMGEAAKAHLDVGPQRVSEYAAMSLRPGIGADWFDQFWGDVYPLDAVVSEGRENAPPKFYDRLLKRRDALVLDDAKVIREVVAISRAADNTDDRLAVRESVYMAKVRNQLRSLE